MMKTIITVQLILAVFIICASCKNLQNSGENVIENKIAAAAPCKRNDDCKFFEKCKSSSEGSFCSCPNGKSGAQCEIVDDCVGGNYSECRGDDRQCVYNDEIEAAECNCTKGKKWDQPVYKCRTTCKDDCKNSAECQGDNDAKFCKCKRGTAGDLCERIDDCDIYRICGDNEDVKCVYNESIRGGACRCDNPSKVFLREAKRCTMRCRKNDDCQHFEKCKATAAGSFCFCPNGKSGQRCEIIDDCVKGKYSYCTGNNGQCMYNDEIEAAECICKEGQKWDQQQRRCRTTCKDDCLNSGECKGGVEAKFCKCKKGTVGDLCETIYDCDKYRICGYHKDVKCIYNETIEGGVCQCENPYKVFSRVSEKCITPCKNNADCQLFEKCISRSGEKFCTCPNGKSGKSCEIIDDCVHGKYRNCKGNNGQCVYNDEIEAAECNCTKEKRWNEQKQLCLTPCETNDDCRIFERCNATSEGKFCICPKSKIGERCEIIYDCAYGKYQNCKGNNGQCIYNYETEAAECICMKGKKWDKREKSCRTICKDDCQNYGECKEDGDSKFCACMPGTRGNLCEIVDYCFCGDSKDVQCVYDRTIGGGSCLCKNPNKVFSRELKKCLTPCNDNCKNYGQCQGDGDYRFCHCKPETSGDFCEIVNNCTIPTFCGSNSDVHCEYDEVNGGATCKCDDPMKHFDNNLKKCRNPCTSNPCQNGGTCILTDLTFRCICPKLVSGTFCEIDNRYILASALVLIILVFFIILCGGCCLLKINQKFSQIFETSKPLSGIS